MELSYRDLDRTAAYARLRGIDAKAISLKTLLTADRIAKCSIPAGGGLTFNYAAKKATDEVLDALQQLADEQQLIAKYEDLYNGAFANVGEKRMVLHHLLRGQLGNPVVHGGKDLGKFYTEQQKKIAGFCAVVHKGERKGSTGKKFKVAVQIGIGGSDLGPRALYLALEQYARERKLQKMEARFISNVDPDDANAVLAGLKLETTLFILVSKSGTTQETLANEQLVRAKLSAANLDPSLHMVAVTSETSPLAKSSDYAASFFIDDFIGGRYSSTSAVGGAILSLAFGPKVFDEILAGAHEADVLARHSSLRENAVMMDAMIGVWERNFLGYPYTAVLPYSQALLRFPAHLQQLDMESNGKCVNRDNERLTYSTGPVVFGEPGTNGQHSFYQLLHQGTDIVPLQFVGFKAAQTGFDIDVEGSTSQKKLNANLTAQIAAFALGKESRDNPNRNFEGERPSSLLHGDQLTPKALGALLAHFENKVMFQGLAWNINSFDQEGVQLGKILTKDVLAGTKDDRLATYARLLGV
ncbi:MAG TPA: glucose-6-phosphate isomerase [Sedimentisphaerales bacterium]|nr:glucose-6-phosphate isomerase [Sedimentisphaerales bacterium]